MDQIYPDNGLVYMLKSVVYPTVNFRLFVNNLTPGLGNVPSDFTEAAWSGYSAQSVAEASWTFSQVTSHVGSLQAPNVSFANTSGSSQNAYGYFVTDSTNTYVIFCARFDAAPLVIPNGGALPVTPIVSNYSALAS